MAEPVLCYIDGNWAFFTTQKLSDQCGDDWNDAPYEHNAGRPYAVKENHDYRKARWEIVQAAWEGPFVEPREHHLNSPWTVQQINRHAHPWLISDECAKARISVWAGTTLSRFVELVQKAGGKVFIEAAS